MAIKTEREIASWLIEYCYNGKFGFPVIILYISLQCFDTVGWVTGRASGL